MNLFGWLKPSPAKILRLEQIKLQTLQVQKARENLERLYDASQLSQYWKRPGDGASGNAVMNNAGSTIRNFARNLDENHDLAVGVLDDLSRKIIGCGVQVEPMAKLPSGELHNDLNQQLRNLWAEWTQSMPEASRTIPWAQIELMICRTWLRDGEVFIQHLEGNAPIRHRSRVPYSIELIEPDYCPFDLWQDSTKTQNRIVHGVEMNDWKEPVGYWFYKEHPGDTGIPVVGLSAITRDFKRVNADNVTHIKFIRRINQARGVSVFHSVLRRLEDIKEYEESERIAARVAAAMCAAITRSTDFVAPQLNADTGNRNMEFNPGMIFDGLLPGENISTIGANRPNTGLADFRNAMIRAVSSGTGASYSGISHNYDGTYSAQRQELVESWIGYETLREYLFGVFYRPLWQRFVRMSVASGVLKFSAASVDLNSIFMCDLVGPRMPWIDPVKEVDAQAKAIEAGLTSRHMCIRENQLDPAIVDEQIKNDPLREMLAEAKNPTPKPAVADDDEPEQSTNAA